MEFFRKIFCVSEEKSCNNSCNLSLLVVSPNVWKKVSEGLLRRFLREVVAENKKKFESYDPIKLGNELGKWIKVKEREDALKSKERENLRITVKSFVGGERFEMKRVKLYQKRVEEEWRALKSKREERRRKGIMSHYNKKKQKRRR